MIKEITRKKVFIFFKVFIFYCFLFSGLMKWGNFFPFDPTLLFGSICSYFFIIELLKNTRKTFTYSTIPYGIALFVWIAIACTYGLSKEYYQYKFLQTLLVFLGLFYPIVVFKKEYYLKMVVLSLTILTFGALCFLSVLYSMTGGDLEVYFKLADIGVNGKTALPDYLAIGDLLVTTMLVNLFNTNRFIIFSQILAFLFLVWLSGRGPIVGLLLMATIGFILRFKFNIKSVIIATLLLVGTTIGYSYLMVWEGSSRLQSRFETGMSGEDGGLEGRRIMFNQAIDGALESPLIGLGFGSFGMYSINSDERYYPHNMFLEVLCETGFIGFLLLFLLVASYLVSPCWQFLTNNISKNSMYLGFPLASLALLMQTLKASSIGDLRITFSFIGLVIIAHHILLKSNNPDFRA
jgi:O-antigen ligase